MGDAYKAVALELDLNIASINNFGANGTFDAKLARVLVNRSNFRLAASVGVVNIAEWGHDPKADTNPKFKQTLQISGGGGETFAFEEENVGMFGSRGPGAAQAQALVAAQAQLGSSPSLANLKLAVSAFNAMVTSAEGAALQSLATAISPIRAYLTTATTRL